MEMIIMLAVIAALIALVYWKNVKNDVSVSAGQRPEEQEVTAKLDYFSEATGWHATFYNGSVLCHGVFVNLSKDKAAPACRFLRSSWGSRKEIGSFILCAPEKRGGLLPSSVFKKALEISEIKL